MEVDFIFSALRREGKSRTLITFCSHTFLCTAWLASLVGASFVGNLLYELPQNSTIWDRSSAACHFCLPKYWRKGNRVLESLW